jgi:ABC-type nitrate/sulfonate/bicarbonate transport system ATPase subunit
VKATSGILSIRGVSRTFSVAGRPPTVALQATDLEVDENDFITILGPSGCGKSTLLRIVAGLDRQSTGEVLAVASKVRARIAAWYSRATRSSRG